MLPTELFENSFFLFFFLPQLFFFGTFFQRRWPISEIRVKRVKKSCKFPLVLILGWLSSATDVQKPNIMLFQSFTNGKTNYDMHFSAKFANFACYSAICAEKVKPAKIFMM